MNTSVSQLHFGGLLRRVGLPASGILIILVTLLAGCAAFSPDGGMGTVQSIAGPTLNKGITVVRSEEEAGTARAMVERLLKAPLSADAAVQVALLSNRDLQASYHALGVSEAVLVEAALPPNPAISVSYIAGGGGLEFERQIAGEILALATLPARTEIAADRFRQAQLATALAILRTAANTRRAYYRAVAARALEDFLNQSQATADATNQLSRRLGESGALNKLDQARNQVFDAELIAELANARRRTVSEREGLIRRMVCGTAILLSGCRTRCRHCRRDRAYGLPLKSRR